MTPTEQDEELREKIAELMFLKLGIEAKIKQLITADRKRVELEARVDELQALNEQREWQSLDGVYKEINERIAELKAQQEEKHGRNG